jgi:hypothetical protein
MDESTENTLRRLLEYDRIAVVGCSGTPGKAAHDVPQYMQRQGYDIVPVNPNHDSVLGERSYDTLADVETDIQLVNVFRPSAEIPDVIEQVLARTEQSGDVEGVWIQLGIRHDDAAERARDAGLTVVQDRCIKVEHQRLWG